MSACIDHAKVGDKDGYLTAWYDNKSVRAHRLAYCFSRGIPLDYIKGSVVRHTCDNPRCINPQHLLIGTHQDNVDDKVGRNRQVRGTQMHTNKLTETNVLAIRKLYVKGSKGFGMVALGRMFGVHPSVVHDILHRKLWKHI